MSKNPPSDAMVTRNQQKSTDSSPAEQVVQETAVPVTSPQAPTPCRVAELFSRLKGKFEVGKLNPPEECNIAKTWIYETMTSILGSTDVAEFRKDWATFLRFVNKTREVTFTESLIYIHTDKWAISPQDEKRYRFLVHVAMRTCDQNTRRKEWNKIDHKTLMTCFSNTERANLEMFYGQ